MSESLHNARPMVVTVTLPQVEGFGLLELWRALFDRKWIIAGVALACAVVGAAYALVATPIYRAEVVLAQATNGLRTGSQLGGLASLAGINLQADDRNAQAMAVLESRKFLAEFIDEEKLLTVLYADEWDAEHDRWKGKDRDVRDAVKFFAKDVRFIEKNRESGLVTMAVEWKDPVIASRWVSALVIRINQKMRQRDIEEAGRKLKYLYKQLEEAQLVELRQAISRVIEEQIKSMMLAQAEEEYAFRVVDPAVVPKQRVRPKRALIVIIAGLFGGFAAVLFVLARVGMQRMLRRDEEDASRSSDG